MTTKALMCSTCRYCRCPIGLSHWSGWIDLSYNGSHDMCPGTMCAAHQPARSSGSSSNRHATRRVLSGQVVDPLPPGS